MFKIGDLVKLTRFSGLKNCEGGRIAEVVSPDEFPKLREKLYQHFLTRVDGITKEQIDNDFIAVKWVRWEGVNAVDGFYGKYRFDLLGKHDKVDCEN